MENNPYSSHSQPEVMGPPPSYDSVVYGNDAASGVIRPGTNISPPSAPYPNAPYTYPVPPSYPVNPAYPSAASQPQYPTMYSTSQTTGTMVQPTIVCANQQPQTTTGGCRRVIIITVCVVFFFIIVIIAWNLSLH